MSVFRNVVLLAAGAGLLAGIFLAVMQLTVTSPLIFKAEVFEQAAETGTDNSKSAGHHAGAAAGTGAATQQVSQAHDQGAHQHNNNAWEPADGFERSAYTVMANIVTAIGFALLLVVASEFAGGLTGWRNGLVWGLAGFAVFTLAPGLGLPPELPAMPAADLYDRQTWWAATALATAAGLAFIVFGRHPLLALSGTAILIAPHLVGAPQPADHHSPVPADLHHQFIVLTTITNLLFWLALGAAAGALRNRFLSGEAPNGAPATA